MLQRLLHQQNSILKEAEALFKIWKIQVAVLYDSESRINYENISLLRGVAFVYEN